MISLPPTYAGERDDEACYRWISNVKNYFKGYSILNPSIGEEEQIILVSSCLRDAALEFWRCRTGDRVDDSTPKAPMSLSTAFNLLANYFSPSNEERISRWRSLRQVGSVSQLAETCCVLHNVITPPMTQTQLKDKFWEALDASIINAIEEDRHLSVEDVSFEKLVYAALKAEHIANRNCGPGRTPGPLPKSQRTTAVQLALEAGSSQNNTLRTSFSQPLKIYRENERNKDVNQAMMGISLSDNYPEQHSSPRQSRLRNSLNDIPLGTNEQSRSKQSLDFSKMPKKGSKEWKAYCYARNACLSCGQLTHTRLTCPDHKE